MPPPSSPSLRSAPHIGPLTPFPRHPQASTGGRHRRCLKDVLRTCQETLTYSTHLPRTLSVRLPLLKPSSTQHHHHLHALFLLPLCFPSTQLTNVLSWLMPSSCHVRWKVIGQPETFGWLQRWSREGKITVHSQCSTISIKLVFNYL